MKQKPQEKQTTEIQDGTPKRQSKKLQIIALVAFAVFAVTVTAVAIVLYKSGKFEDFEELVSTMGIWGIPIMLLVQIMQVLFAVIPGEPIELAMGAMYGTLGGLFMALFGCVIGSALIFLIVKKLGASAIYSLTDSKGSNKLKFLKNPSRRDVLVFLLMFIPGTPKDLLTYFAPFSGIRMVRFLVISTVARIPSIVSSTYVGKNIAGGNWVRGLVAFAIVGAVSIIGIIIYNKIIDMKNASGENEFSGTTEIEEDSDDN